MKAFSTLFRLGVACVLLGLALPLAKAAEVERPNFIIIFCDDLGYADIGPFGSVNHRTPNLDRMAAEGRKFTSFYVTSGVCSPSRSSLMTGILPSTSGVYLNSQPWRAAMPNAVTLPQHFMKHGYWAGGSGKIYHGPFPDPASWNTYWPSPTKNKPNDPQPPRRPPSGRGLVLARRVGKGEGTGRH